MNHHCFIHISLAIIAICKWYMFFGIYFCKVSASGPGRNNVGRFDSSGRLPMMEKAYGASTQGGSVLVVRTEDCVIGISWTLKLGPVVLSVPSKIQKVSHCLALAGAGVTSDIDFMLDKLREFYAEHMYCFDSPPPMHRIASSLADQSLATTLTSIRPFGAALCLFGCESSVGFEGSSSNSGQSNPCIWEVAPGGSVLKCDRFCSIGK